MPPSSVSVALRSHSKRTHFGIWPTAIKLNPSGKTEVSKSDWLKPWYTYIYIIYIYIIYIYNTYIYIYICIYIYIKVNYTINVIHEKAFRSNK